MKIIKYCYVVLMFLSCTAQEEKIADAKIKFQYSYAIELGNNEVDSARLSKEIFQADSLYLRFRHSFLKDSAVVYVGNKLFKKLGNITTDKSIAYARTMSIPKKLDNAILLHLNNRIYSIPIKREFAYIDLFFNNDILTVRYNNTFLLLS